MLSIRPYGDQALLVEMAPQIDPRVNAAVIALAEAVEAAALPGLLGCTPAYCSLTVQYDPAVLPYQEARRQLLALAAAPALGPATGAGRLVRVPVCYEGALAPDLEEVATLTGLSPQEVVGLHTATELQVYMLGFLPGFAYMGRLPAALACARKATPRLRVPAQAVGLAGLQTGIYPAPAPGGWQLIGRTPLPVFDPDRAQPFLFRAGDRVRFHAVSETDFHTLAAAPAAAVAAALQQSAHA